MADGQDTTQGVPYNTPSWADQPQQAPSQAPASADPMAGIDLRSIMAPPSNVDPYISGRGQIQPRMPLPMQQVPTNRPTQMQPADTSVYSRRTAKQQNIGNLLGNMMGMVANQAAMEKQQKNAKTITDATNYVQGIQNAQDLKTAYPNDPRMQKMADDAIKRNTDSFNAMMKDDKTKKMVGKALSWDFTDPKQMQKPEVKAGVAGVQAAKAQQKAGIAATTPQDAQINTILNKGQAAASTMGQQGQFAGMGGAMRPGQVAASPGPRGSVTTSGVAPAAQPNLMGAPSPTAAQQQPSPQQVASPQSRLDQYLSSRPVSMEANPLYAEQQTRQDKIIQYLYPRMITAATQQMVAQNREENANWRAQLRVGEQYRDAAIRQQTAYGTAAIRANSELDRTIRDNKTRMDIANLHMAAITGETSMLPAGSQYAGLRQKLGQKALDEFTQEITRTTTNNDNLNLQNQDLQTKLDKLSKDDPAYQYYKDQLEGNKATIRANQMFMDQMRDQRQKYSDKIFGKSTYTPQSARPDSGATAGGGAASKRVPPAIGMVTGIPGFLSRFMGGDTPENRTTFVRNVQGFGDAIGAAEGFGASSSNVPSRTLNPGDLKIRDIGYGVEPNGIIRFPNDEMGRRALQQQLGAIASGQSKKYNPDMTIREMAPIWTGNDNPEAWANTVATKLGVSPNTRIGDILGDGGASQAETSGVTPAGPPSDSEFDDEDRAIEHTSSEDEQSDERDALGDLSHE